MNTTTARQPAMNPGTGDLLDRCPACGAGMLYQVGATTTGRFLCRSCLRCWQPGRESCAAVDVATCPGCEWRWACESRLD